MTLKRETSPDVDATVRDIITAVRIEGDRAVKKYTAEFDRFDVDKLGMAITPDEMARAKASCDAEALDALQFAAHRIAEYHRRQLPEDKRYTDEEGVRLGWRWTPIDAVGLYVPGGLAAYPSSVLMNAVPARVAGAERLVMVVPSPEGQLSPLVLAAAELAGVTEIYRIGGAQAIAALAYGTETIAPVDKIVGPGNAYVAAAKRQVFGQVGIDSIAGPSEVLVLADGQNNPDWIAIDLLSQAEHDASAQAILITDDKKFADAVAAAADKFLQESPRHNITQAAWRENSAIIVTPSIAEGVPLINRLAPEHLELAVDEPEGLLPDIRHAGAIFMGRHTPEAVGDYVAGPDHVLPTARAARFSAGLSVLDFIKRSSIIECTPEALAAIGPAAARLADEEGLWAHARSIRERLK
ncbi:MAG: histidinol dehydrogenase [Pseudomonadota bacterium]